MDGSGFLFDLPVSAAIGEMFRFGDTDGILYVEDFDAAPAPLPPETIPEPEPEAPEPVFSAADIEAAHAAGRAEGAQVALEDARLLQAQLQAAATQALADALSAGRAVLDRIAAQQAEATARTVLAILQAAVPHTLSLHARTELDAVIAALLPGMRCEPELRVRVNPSLADHIRESLIGLLAEESGVLAVAADAALAPGDIQINWADGGARRECGEIYAAIRDALAPLGLPTPEEICRGQRS